MKNPGSTRQRLKSDKLTQLHINFIRMYARLEEY